MIKLEEEEKFVLIYALFKLELVRGKTLMFVSTVDRCYKASDCIKIATLTVISSVAEPELVEP